MIFFLPWVVFILVAIMAVPIAHMMDKKKARARFGDDHLDDAFGQMEDDDALQDVQEDNNMALEEPEAVDDLVQSRWQPQMASMTTCRRLSKPLFQDKNKLRLSSERLLQCA